MRSLKILVVAMGIMLVGGFALLVAIVASKLLRGGNRSFATTTIDIPRDARLEAMTTGPDRLILELVLPEGGHQLVIVDLATGMRLGTIELRARP
jgi:hypothetical protein